MRNLLDITLKKDKKDVNTKKKKKKLNRITRLICQLKGVSKTVNEDGTIR